MPAPLGVAAFRFAERTGEPSGLVGVPEPAPDGRLALLVRPSRRALVLGSAQGESVVDLAACEAAGMDVVRRRSGGGAVVVGPGEQVWLDAFVPRDDPLHEADVSRAAWWLGEVWVAALAEAGMPGGTVHRGAMATGAYGRVACFAGLGPGEVTLDGRKLVGISQRRDRSGAWFFTMALCPAPGAGPPLARLLRLAPTERRGLERHLAATTTGLSVPAGDVEGALRAHLG